MNIFKMNILPFLPHALNSNSLYTNYNVNGYIYETTYNLTFIPYFISKMRENNED